MCVKSEGLYCLTLQFLVYYHLLIIIILKVFFMQVEKVLMLDTVYLVTFSHLLSGLSEHWKSADESGGWFQRHVAWAVQADQCPGELSK